MIIDNKKNSKVAIIAKDEMYITTLQDALDLMANIRYQDCSKILLHKESLSESFFDLKTKFAGEMLQKYTNYNTRLAIVGDLSMYNSKSLRDFIYECNNGQWVFFKDTVEEGLKVLHEVA